MWGARWALGGLLLDGSKYEAALSQLRNAVIGRSLGELPPISERAAGMKGGGGGSSPSILLPTFDMAPQVSKIFALKSLIHGLGLRCDLAVALESLNRFEESLEEVEGAIEDEGNKVVAMANSGALPNLNPSPLTFSSAGSSQPTPQVHDEDPAPGSSSSKTSPKGGFFSKSDFFPDALSEEGGDEGGLSHQGGDASASQLKLGLSVRIAALSQLGRLLTRMGRISQALPHLEEVLAWDGEDVDATVALVDALLLQYVAGLGSASSLGRCTQLLQKVRTAYSEHAYCLFLTGRLEEVGGGEGGGSEESLVTASRFYESSLASARKGEAKVNSYLSTASNSNSDFGLGEGATPLSYFSSLISSRDPSGFTSHYSSSASYFNRISALSLLGLVRCSLARGVDPASVLKQLEQALELDEHLDEALELLNKLKRDLGISGGTGGSTFKAHHSSRVNLVTKTAASITASFPGTPNPSKVVSIMASLPPKAPQQQHVVIGQGIEGEDLEMKEQRQAQESSVLEDGSSSGNNNNNDDDNGKDSMNRSERVVDDTGKASSGKSKKVASSTSKGTPNPLSTTAPSSSSSKQHVVSHHLGVGGIATAHRYPSTAPAAAYATPLSKVQPSPSRGKPDTSSSNSIAVDSEKESGEERKKKSSFESGGDLTLTDSPSAFMSPHEGGADPEERKKLFFEKMREKKKEEEEEAKRKESAKVASMNDEEKAQYEKELAAKAKHEKSKEKLINSQLTAYGHGSARALIGSKRGGHHTPGSSSKK